MNEGAATLVDRDQRESLIFMHGSSGKGGRSMLTDAIARKLGIEPKELERESLQAYLEGRRRQVEAQLFVLATKHGRCPDCPRVRCRDPAGKDSRGRGVRGLLRFRPS